MKILVSDNLSKLGVEILQKESGIEVDVNTGLSKEELIKIIPEYEGLIVRSATKVTADVIAAAKNLTERVRYLVIASSAASLRPF